MKVISDDYDNNTKRSHSSKSNDKNEPEDKSKLSDRERERLREKVKMISMKIANKDTPTAMSKDEDRKHKKHKKKKRKYAKFEGERVSHLDKTDVYQAPKQDEDDREKDDDYVLSKLFKKSGVHSALRHDVIMNGDGGADFALIDAEAERVAKEAVQRMRESRRECFRASDGIPTFTGQNGLSKRPRFGKIPKKSSTNPSASSEAMSAQDLLKRMKERNRLMPNQNREHFFDGQDLFTPEGFNSNVELLADIRNFIAFQNSSAGDGEATTNAIVDYFKEKLPPIKNPLFKALLNEICSFDKTNKIWRLKEEFR